VKVIGWFWDVITDYSEEDRAKLLQFTTGTSRVPAQGFQAMQSHDNRLQLFCIKSVNEQHFPYPRAHTCFNRIDLPMFETKEDLKEKLDAVIQMDTVFSME
jgi:E3 ubiquitin ligase SMURF1/2/E3 ubiquitin-protein ligase NEDD4